MREFKISRPGVVRRQNVDEDIRCICGTCPKTGSVDVSDGTASCNVDCIGNGEIDHDSATTAS